MPSDNRSSSDLPLPRFERVLKALTQVPKKEVEEQQARERQRRKRSGRKRTA